MGFHSEEARGLPKAFAHFLESPGWRELQTRTARRMCSLAMGGLLTSTIETWPRGKGVVIKKERFNRHLAARIGEPVPYWFAQVVGFASPPRFFSSPPEFGASLPSLGDMLRWSCCPRSSSEQWIFGDGQHEHRGDGSYTFEGDRFRAPPAHLCLGKKIADELGEDDPVSRFLSGFFWGGGNRRPDPM